MRVVPRVGLGTPSTGATRGRSSTRTRWIATSSESSDGEATIFKVILFCSTIIENLRLQLLIETLGISQLVSINSSNNASQQFCRRVFCRLARGRRRAHLRRVPPHPAAAAPRPPVFFLFIFDTFVLKLTLFPSTTGSSRCRR